MGDQLAHARHGVGAVRPHARPALLVALALAACGGGATAPADGAPVEVPGDVPPQAERVGAASLGGALGASATYSGIRTRERRVVRGAAEWAELWAQATSIVLPAPAAPAVDFTRDEVIVAAMGTRSSGGHGIAIEAVYEADGRRWVVVRETSRAASCVVTAALTAPVAAVRVARSALPTVFVERTTVAACG